MMLAVELCPCCRQPLPPDGKTNWDVGTRTFIGNGVAVRFTDKEAQIVDALWRRRNRPFNNKREMADTVYADDPDGGPEDADNLMSVFVCRIRPKLAAVGWGITKNQGRPKRGIALVPLPHLQGGT